jgi:hypothetical protein
MLLLDENLPAHQRQSLREWRVRFRVVSVDLALAGTADENLIPMLHRLAQPTFFSLDRNFYRPAWTHPRYGLVWLDVPDDRAAATIQRFLAHPAFDTAVKRLGIAARVHADGILVWRFKSPEPQSLPWPAK